MLEPIPPRDVRPPLFRPAHVVFTEPTTVVLVSGGVTSTAALWQCIQGPVRAIHAHHVDLRTEEHLGEGHAVDRIAGWIAAQGHAVTWSASTIALPGAPRSVEVAMFVGGWFSVADAVRQVVTGGGQHSRARELFDAFGNRAKLSQPLQNLSAAHCRDLLPPALAALTWPGEITTAAAVSISLAPAADVVDAATSFSFDW